MHNPSPTSNFFATISFPGFLVLLLGMGLGWRWIFVLPLGKTPETRPQTFQRRQQEQKIHCQNNLPELRSWGLELADRECPQRKDEVEEVLGRVRTRAMLVNCPSENQPPQQTKILSYSICQFLGCKYSYHGIMAHFKLPEFNISSWTSWILSNWLFWASRSHLHWLSTQVLMDSTCSKHYIKALGIGKMPSLGWMKY